MVVTKLSLLFNCLVDYTLFFKFFRDPLPEIRSSANATRFLMVISSIVIGESQIYISLAGYRPFRTGRLSYETPANFEMLAYVLDSLGSQQQSLTFFYFKTLAAYSKVLKWSNVSYCVALSLNRIMTEIASLCFPKISLISFISQTSLSANSLYMPFPFLFCQFGPGL